MANIDRNSPSTLVARRVGELEPLVQRNTAQLGSIFKGGHPHMDALDVDYFRATYGPLPVIGFTSSNVQSIPDNTGTALDWQIQEAAFHDYRDFEWSSLLSSQISVRGVPLGHVSLVFGHVQFVANTSGYREVGLTRHYGGSSVSGDTLVKVGANPVGGEITSLSFASRWAVEASSITGERETHLTVDVKQNSGGALNVLFAQVYLTRLY